MDASADGLFLYVRERTKSLLPAKVYQLELATGCKKPWKEFQPADSTGITSVWSILLTPDGKSYVYSYNRLLSDLYLVEGLK